MYFYVNLLSIVIMGSFKNLDLTSFQFDTYPRPLAYYFLTVITDTLLPSKGFWWGREAVNGSVKKGIIVIKANIYQALTISRLYAKD